MHNIAITINAPTVNKYVKGNDVKSIVYEY